MNMNLKISKDDILEKLNHDNLHLAELADSAKRSLRNVSRRKQKPDLGKTCIIIAGAAAAVSVAGLAGHYLLYRCVVSKELKRQMKPMANELAILQDENRRLSAEVSLLKARAEASESTEETEAPAENE